MEALAGASDKRVQDQVVKAVSSFSMVYLTDSDMDWAMEQQLAFRLSHGVGILDCLIAAPAYRLKLPLYTRNLKHFEPLLGPLARQPY